MRYVPDRLWKPQHPLYRVMFSKAGERLRGKLLMACKKAADRLIDRILFEAMQWAVDKPGDILIALWECERRLAALADDAEVGPFVGPILHAVTEAIEGLLDRIARGELEVRMVA